MGQLNVGHIENFESHLTKNVDYMMIMDVILSVQEQLWNLKLAAFVGFW
jgi:hypothetical protein